MAVRGGTGSARRWLRTGTLTLAGTIALAIAAVAESSPAATAPAVRISISAPTVVAAGDRLVVSGGLRGRLRGARGSHQVRLEERVARSWRLRARTLPTARGRYVVRWRVPNVQRTRVFRVRLLRARRVLATSKRVRVAVRKPKVTPPGPTPPAPPPPPGPPPPVPVGLVVSGNRLLDSAGGQVQLRGVNRAVFESACTWDPAYATLADGPTDEASVNAMVAWKMNTVRVALNTQCWLGINGLPRGGSAAAYQQAVKNYVALLRSKNLFVVLEVHYTAPGAYPSSGPIDYMPDADHTPAFWAQVADAFKTDAGILFDPINEVALAGYAPAGLAQAALWPCWRDGCVLNSIHGGTFQAAGMQLLVNTIRAAGASQPILLGGLGYTADASGLLAHLPADPRNALIASLHVYNFTQDTASFDARFASEYLPVAQKMPLVIGELGEIKCDDAGGAPFTHHVLYNVVNAQQASGTVIGVLGWTWNAVGGGWACPTGAFGEGGPVLIRSYDGTPTVMGSEFKAWFATK